jgi:predicted outer membrane repeat protein
MQRTIRRTTILAGLATGLSLGLARIAQAGTVLEVPGPLNFTLQEAIDIAESLGVTQLNIAPGVYAESLLLPSNGYDLVLVGNPDDPGQVVIDPSLADPPILNSAVHILGGQSAATQLVGLTLRGGNADGVSDGDPASHERGGGLYADNSSVAVIDCVFENNTASLYGGAVYSNAATTTSFTRCQFIGNQAANGGAAYVNSGQLTFTDCTFTSNDALSGLGGALRVQCETTIEDCTFEDNSTSADGGAVWKSSSPMTITRSLFVGNGANGLGGAMYVAGSTADIRDSILNGNTAGNTGSATYNQEATSLTLVNVTAVQNVGGTALTGDGSRTATSCIIWNNTSGQIDAATVSYSMVESGFAGSGNIDPPGGPSFVDPVGADGFAGTLDDDLRLAADSPAIDAGDSAAVLLGDPVDYDGLSRGLDDPDTADTGQAVLGVVVDMGAFEFQPVPPPPACAGDSNDDGVIDIVDLLAVLSAWGSCP